MPILSLCSPSARSGLRPNFCLLTSLLLLLSACTHAPVASPPIDERLLEEKVLQVIRKNPAEILKALTQFQQDQVVAQQKAAESAQRALIAQLDLPSLVGDSPTLGNPKRQILLFEFSDFQCPYCASAADTLRKFVEKHHDEVTLVYKHLPLTDIHPEAERAARAAWAAGRQGQFWEYHDALFARQRELKEPIYPELAAKLGLDLKIFDHDRRSDAAAVAVQQDMALGAQLQISGTPFFLMQREPFAGALPLEALEKILQRVKGKPGHPSAAVKSSLKVLARRESTKR